MPDVKALLQLCRLPNVFTAVSNVAAGYLLTHSDLTDWPAFVLLVGSSALLYTAGMVLNDVFDLAQDTAERPHRPIPSGRIALGTARALVWTLLLGGVALAGAVTAWRQTMTPILVAAALAAMVVLYDGPLKRTPLAPLAMGTCRFLNVLLGMSLGTIGTMNWHPIHWCVAAGIGIYVVGLTWFARTEAQAASNRFGLFAGTLVMLAGVGLLGYFPRLADDALPPLLWPLPNIQLGWVWPAMWILFAFFTIRRALPAIVNPSPRLVQFAVKQAIFAIIIFDAAIIAAVHTPLPYSVAVVALLFPMQILGSYVYST
ncbi:MAG: UbiA family prenyltransferase [Planctomycetales bacterium]|nr:UbiA family prenyltransferase [Planctomycetales bacterium]MBN8624988.1 UbiA family prenyltransferase [Planctomycetota bacterium]